MIIGDILKAIGQLTDPRFRRVIGLGVGLSAALFIGAYFLIIFLIGLFDFASITLPFFGQIDWLGTALSVGSFALMVLLSFFLMIPVASAITSMFLDTVAEAVEDAHYPGLPAAPKVGLTEALRDTVSFLGVLIGANILAFALYLILPFASVLIFYLLNGFLLGREYFTMAAIRREGRERTYAMRKKHGTEIWIAGCLMALPLTIPLVNLLIPVLGAATFTHLYHRLERRA
jgi:CysZ protein